MSDPRPQLLRTSHVGIQVASLERSLAFYCDLLGFEAATTWVRDEPYIEKLVGYPGAVLNVAVLRLPGTDVFLEVLEYRNVERKPVDTGTANPGTAHLCFYVDDLNSVYQGLVGQGVGAVSGPVEPTAGPHRGGRVVYMLDPDGIRVELVQTSTKLFSSEPGALARDSVREEVTDEVISPDVV